MAKRAKKASAEVKEINRVLGRLELCFQKESWSDLAEALHDAAKVGERLAHRELCLRAQSLQNILHNRTRGDATFLEMTDLYDEVTSQLTHLRWLHQEPAKSLDTALAIL